MNYFFKYLVQYSNFFHNTIGNRDCVYFDASYLYNFQNSCYNLVSKKNLDYFIDPETHKFQYGGNRKFYLQYLEYFEELDDLFNNGIINLDFFSNPRNLNDFYKKIIRFQRTMLAKSFIPLDFYKAIAEGRTVEKRFNPVENLSFMISPYFEFETINDDFYNLTVQLSRIDPKNYVILRFPKELLSDVRNTNRIYRDFRNCGGILINVLELDQYNISHLNNYFKNLIDLIFRFTENGQNVILMNNSEFGKYLAFFGLKSVCSQVLIGQQTKRYQPLTPSRGASNQFVYISQIERSVSIPKGEVLLRRNPSIDNPYDDDLGDIQFNDRIAEYYRQIQQKINIISSNPIDSILTSIENAFNNISIDRHRTSYNYILKWKEILQEKVKTLLD